ncbi:MAG: class I SAM-dependent methyltransferase [Candidatus Omnitrophota bacterium]|jgi:SAM-dependent methyltransferase
MSKKFESEQEFHNRWAENIPLEDLRVRESFESPTALENRFALERMGDLRGKRILDLGCGAGETAVYFSLAGAEVTGCDISERSLEVGEALAGKFGTKVRWVHGSASSLAARDSSFDLVYANGVLHHVRLSAALKEVRRVLAPGGTAVFIEPLAYNPVINVYRKMAAGVRSEFEQPLRRAQIEKIRTFFPSFERREFWLFSLLIFLHFFFVRRWHPSKVRYWKKVIDEGQAYRGMIGFLEKLDRGLLRIFPFLGWWCWNTVIVVQK